MPAREGSRKGGELNTDGGGCLSPTSGDAAFRDMASCDASRSPGAPLPAAEPKIMILDPRFKG